MALLSLVKKIPSSLQMIRIVALIVRILVIAAKNLTFRQFQRNLLLMSDVDLHHIQRELIFDILGDIVAVLSVAITDAKVPKVFNLSEVFDYEEVVLVGFAHAVCGLARSSQVSELGNIIIHFSDRLLWLLRWLAGLLSRGMWPGLAVRKPVATRGWLLSLPILHLLLVELLVTIRPLYDTVL